MVRPFAALLAVVAIAWAAALGGQPARANGVPQLVKLTYLDGVSNWGPTSGEGVLEFSFAEAYARVDVKNLAPQAGFVYEGWLSGGEGQPFWVGDIKVDAAGIGALETRLANLSRYDYNLFLIAARPADAAPTAVIPKQHSIAGRFTIISSTSGGSNGDTQPALLPNTGERASNGMGTPTRLALTAGAMTLAAGLILGVRYLVARRSK